jgi:hypothetical protein
MTEETTLMHPFKYKLRFRFFERGHNCGIKVKLGNENRRIMCNCTVFYNRVTRPWWKPFEFVGQKLSTYLH